MQAAALLSTFHIRQLPVVKKNGKMVGYLNRTDVKLAVSKVLSQHATKEHHKSSKK
jgi:CBS domain-containing protein